MAVRPRSFAVAASPVLVAVAYAHWQDGAVDLVLAAMALLCAVLMQAITNLQNDVGFHQRGGESTGQRVGLPRASTLGLLTPSAIRSALLALALISLMLGICLAYLRGWPVLAIGAASLVGAVAYMGGPRPIAYTPLGELTVLMFFGWVAVLGTLWLLGVPIGAVAVLLATAGGCIAAAALAVNNHRDRQHDQSIGRSTFAAVMGTQASQQLFSVLLLVALACVGAAAWLSGAAWVALPLLLAPRLWRLNRDFRASAEGNAFNPILYRTFKLQLEFALVLGLGLTLASLATAIKS